MIMLELQLDQNHQVTIITQEMIDNMSDEEYLGYLGLTEEEFESWMSLIDEINE